MHSLVFLFLISASSCRAHYRGNYDSRNVIEREELQTDIDIGTLVECPVCESSSSWLSTPEECPIEKDNKKYKRCTLGTYVNEVCGNRLDCFRGPGEQCTEKMIIDYFGHRCARGYFCNGVTGECTGLKYSIDSNVQWLLNPNRRYPLRDRRQV